MRGHPHHSNHPAPLHESLSLSPACPPKYVCNKISPHWGFATRVSATMTGDLWERVDRPRRNTFMQHEKQFHSPSTRIFAILCKCCYYIPSSSSSLRAFLAVLSSPTTATPPRCRSPKAAGSFALSLGLFCATYGGAHPLRFVPTSLYFMTRNVSPLAAPASLCTRAGQTPLLY